MPDIRICHELINKPEVHAIASYLNLDVNATIGILVRVWIWADQHTDDGHSMHSPKLLENIIGVSGLIDALASVGWIELPGSGFRLPNLDRYTGDGRTTKSRRNRARSESQGKPRAANGRFKPKNPATTSTPKDAGSTSGPDRSRTRPRTDPVPHKTSLPISDSEYYMASHDKGVQDVLKVWKAHNSVGSPRRATEAIWAILSIPEGPTSSELVEASEAYLKSPAAKDRKYRCRAANFFGEGRHELDPEEWNSGDVEGSKSSFSKLKGGE